MKATANNWDQTNYITVWRLFGVLDTLRPTSMGLDKIPAWFLKIGAPFLSAPLSDMFNLSLTSSVVPRQWKAASIMPIPKSSTPIQPADYMPISITPVLSRVLERIVVRDFIYPSFQSPPFGLSFHDQFVFQPLHWFNCCTSHSTVVHYHFPTRHSSVCYCVFIGFFQGI